MRKKRGRHVFEEVKCPSGTQILKGGGVKVSAKRGDLVEEVGKTRKKRGITMQQLTKRE